MAQYDRDCLAQKPNQTPTAQDPQTMTKISVVAKPKK